MATQKQKRLQKHAKSLKKQLSGHIKRYGYDPITEEISDTIERVKKRSLALRRKGSVIHFFIF